MKSDCLIFFFFFPLTSPLSPLALGMSRLATSLSEPRESAFVPLSPLPFFLSLSLF